MKELLTILFISLSGLFSSLGDVQEKTSTPFDKGSLGAPTNIVEARPELASSTLTIRKNKAFNTDDLSEHINSSLGMPAWFDGVSIDNTDIEGESLITILFFPTTEDKTLSGEDVINIKNTIKIYEDK